MKNYMTRQKVGFKVISLLLVMTFVLLSVSACAKPAQPDVTVPTDPTSATNPTNPPTDPTNPPTDPTNPPTDPTNPPTDPTNPPTDPTEPTQEPDDPTEPPTNPPTEPPTNPPTQPPTEPEVAKLNGIELSEFAIVYSEQDFDYSIRAAQYIQTEIFVRTGLMLPLVTDSAQSDARYEIVVGQTSREISSRLTPPSGMAKFAILAEENQIALEGEYFVIAAAAYYFIETYVPSETYSAQIPKEVRVYDPIVEEADNYIFLIGDGMGIYSTMLFEALQNDVEYGDGENVFYGYYLPYFGYSRTDSLSGTTDSAAGGTALACGVKTINGYVGQDQDHNEVQSLTELASLLGKSTAVFSTDTQTGATPAAFTAHADDRDLSFLILESQEEHQRQYGTIIGSDYNFETEAKMARLRSNVRNTLNRLGQNEDGFFFMYEEAYIDKHNHNNDLENAFRSMVRFNQVIALMMEYAFYHPNTFVIITADHETGDMKPSGSGYVYTSVNHSSQDVPVFAYGVGGELFDGTTVENVQIPQTIASFMGVDDFGDQTIYQSLAK